MYPETADTLSEGIVPHENKSLRQVIVQEHASLRPIHTSHEPVTAYSSPQYDSRDRDSICLGEKTKTGFGLVRWPIPAPSLWAQGVQIGSPVLLFDSDLTFSTNSPAVMAALFKTTE